MLFRSIPSSLDYRKALDETAIVAVTDLSGRIVECNDLFCEISGYHREELIGKNHKIINSGYHKKSFFTEMYKTISSGSVWRGTIRNKRKNGELYWVDTTIVPTLDQHGHASAYIALRFDVTSHVEALEALATAKDQVVRSSGVKDQFLANMSHEVRTPLNGIVGLAAVLVGGDLSAEQRDMAGLILESGESLRRILDDILDIAKAEAGQVEIETRPFDLRDQVLSAAELLRIRADEKGLYFEVIFDASSEIWVEADALRLRQIISNLISNAIKFTDVGGVRISVAIAASGDGDRLVVEVEDTGVGFDEAIADRLFDRFSQADGTIARRYGGTGLGLAISKNLAGLLGGTLTARSIQGVGSTFRLTMPVRTIAPLMVPQVETSALWPGNDPPHLLLAEDHPTNQLVVKHLLEPLGASVVIANNGREAVDLSEMEAFDLVLMDMQMPVMDGLAAIKAIRQREERLGLPRMPIAMLTANTSEAHRKAALEGGADGFIAKPLTLEALVVGVNALLLLRNEVEAVGDVPLRISSTRS